MSRPAAVLALWLLAGAPLAHGEGWGGIVPGQSVRRDVEARWGRPSTERPVTEGGLTGLEWTYRGDRAPAGMERVVVGFGLLRQGTFAPDLVRTVILYPRPRVFSVPAVVAGWGPPDQIGTDTGSGRPALRYRRGLVVLLNPSGEWAEVMVFAPEQPAEPSPGPPR